MRETFFGKNAVRHQVSDLNAEQGLETCSLGDRPACRLGSTKGRMLRIGAADDVGEQIQDLFFCHRIEQPFWHDRHL